MIQNTLLVHKALFLWAGIMRSDLNAMDQIAKGHLSLADPVFPVSLIILILLPKYHLKLSAPFQE